MRGFWLVICSALAVLVLAMLVASATLPPHYRGAPMPVISRIFAYAVTCSLVLIVWAIFFRRQVQKRQFSLFALGSLIAMEAVLFGAIRFLQSF